jgi:hypothetical protein
MAYSALVRRLLVSCPGDVPERDLAVVHKAINRWNGVYGESFGAVIIPISWGAHAAAEFGGAPQDILNEQLVDKSDICLALFANRLGTPTATAESGTAEEIERLGDSGRYVAILRSRRPVDPGTINLQQAQQLEEYLRRIGEKALILNYADDDELNQRVDTILAAAVSRDQGRADLQREQTSGQVPVRVAELWPRLESSESAIEFPDRRVRLPYRNWRLVLTNTGDAPARDVRVALEAYNNQESAWVISRDEDHSDGEPDVEVLAPHGEIAFPLSITREMPGQVRAVVSWSDDRGRQENVATLRST